MPEVRRRTGFDAIGASVAGTSLGVARGAGIAVELARVKSNQGRPLTQNRTADLYTGSDSHGPGSDLTHTFSFPVAAAGIWVAQINAVVDTDGTSGEFGIAVSGGAPEASLGPIPLSGVGDASGIVTAVINAGAGDLDVLVTVAASGSPTVEFTVEVTAYRIS